MPLSATVIISQDERDGAAMSIKKDKLPTAT